MGPRGLVAFCGGVARGFAARGPRKTPVKTLVGVPLLATASPGGPQGLGRRADSARPGPAPPPHRCCARFQDASALCLACNLLAFTLRGGVLEGSCAAAQCSAGCPCRVQQS